MAQTGAWIDSLIKYASGSDTDMTKARKMLDYNNSWN